MNGEDEPLDDLMYSGEGKKIVALHGIIQKTVLRRAITTLSRSEAKSAMHLRSLPICSSL